MKFDESVRGIFVSGRRWQDRNGKNTYHTVKVAVFLNNGSAEILLRDDPTYGYGSQFEYTAINMLEDAMFVFDVPNNPHSLSYSTRQENIGYASDVVDVQRKSDLH